MAVSNKIQAIPLTSIAASTFTGAYQAINTGLPQACCIVRIINNSSKDVTISYDGTNDHDFVPTLTTFQLPNQSNSQPSNFMALVPIGTIVYVKQAVAGTGSVYLAGYYNPPQV